MNHEFKYNKFFAMIPTGPDTKPSFTKGFFEVAAAQNPKPQTVAMIAADQEFSRNACDGAKDNAKKSGLRTVYDRTYPPNTTDFTPIVRAIQAANPDVVTVCSYPFDLVGFVRAASELNYKPKLIGGAMVGLQATAIKRQLGPLLNGWVNYETWVPAKPMIFEGTEDFLKKYQSRAGAEGVDPLGYYLGTWGYAYIQILGEAVQATKSLNDNALADYIAQTTFKTIMGDVKFGKGGEWGEAACCRSSITASRAPSSTSSGHGHPDGADPAEYKTGDVIFPFEKAK